VTVAIVGASGAIAPIGDGRNDAELLAPVVDDALEAAGVTRDDIGIVCSAGSEFLNGVVGGVMGAFDAFPGWPPRTHSHLEGDGAFALLEAWIRLLAGEGECALVCAWSRPLATEPRRVLELQLDPYVVAPLAPRPEDLAGLQATGAFTALFAGAAVLGGASATDIFFTVILYASLALVAVRFGLLAVAAILLFDNALGDMPASFDSSAWYYPWFVLMVLLCAAAIVWAFVQSIRRTRVGTA